MAAMSFPLYSTEKICDEATINYKQGQLQAALMLWRLAIIRMQPNLPVGTHNRMLLLGALVWPLIHARKGVRAPPPDAPW